MFWKCTGVYLVESGQLDATVFMYKRLPEKKNNYKNPLIFNYLFYSFYVFFLFVVINKFFKL